MAQCFTVHRDNPQARLIARAARVVREGGVIVYPTDSCYALGCHTGDKRALERLRHARGIDERHHLTLMCSDLSELGTYARVDNARYRLLKQLTPGEYTFILEGTRELPRRILHPKRKTIGLRVPGNPVARALLKELDEPLLSATAIVPGESEPATDAETIRARLQHDVDLVLDGGHCGTEPTTIVDLTGPDAMVIRRGKGRLEAMGL